MDSMIAAAARALGSGDPIGALKRVSLRDDPPALALRGIAMAQLGEHPRARDLLRLAARGFGAGEALARARCVVAEAEVALAMRDLAFSPHELSAALSTLEAHADRSNALHARLIAVRRQLLLGRIDEAAAALATLDTHNRPPTLEAVAQLALAEIALRSLRTVPAQAALARADAAARRADVPALVAEVKHSATVLELPAARRLRAGQQDQPLRLAEVERLMSDPGTLVLDGLHRGLRNGGTWLAMTRRPVLFTLALVLARAWPGEVSRNELIADAFRTRRPDQTHRARLRVEIGRLRGLVRPLARIEAATHGFVLLPDDRREVAVVVPPLDGDSAALLALLSDGAAWSTSALAQALDASQRTVQRALAELETERRVRTIGGGRSRRWLAPPLTGFTTILLLPAALPLT